MFIYHRILPRPAPKIIFESHDIAKKIGHFQGRKVLLFSLSHVCASPTGSASVVLKFRGKISTNLHDILQHNLMTLNAGLPSKVEPNTKIGLKKKFYEFYENFL